ncbi:MAG: helix-turn-helix domain-containing protein, partial [Aeromonas sp.]
KMSDFHNNVMKALEKNGLTRKDLSRLSGIDDTGISVMLRKKTRPSAHTAAKIARSLGTTVENLLFGSADDKHGLNYAKAGGDVGAGLWIEVETSADEAPFEPVPAVRGRYDHLPQTAYRIRGPSMDRAGLVDGDFVITVPYFDARVSPVSQDKVIVERREGHLIERTCKEIEVTADAYLLWPRSTDPRYVAPVKIKRGGLDTTGSIEIIALVIGRFTRF